MEHCEVFLCHTGQDTPAVIQLAEKLEKRGIHVWLDLWELKRRLRENLTQHFNREELRTICFDLRIEHENLPDTHDGMARELVAECDRRGRIPELFEKVRQLRPHVPWDGTAGFTSEQLQTTLKTVTAVLILIGKRPWDPIAMQACLSEIASGKLPVIPILLPGSSTLPSDLAPFCKQSKVVNLQSGIDNGLSFLLWRITGNSKSEAHQVGKAMVAEAAESRTQALPQQRIDAWGMALLKNRLHALSEIVASESAEEANRAATTYPDDALTMLVPLIVTLRWHRGYATGLEQLLNIPKPQKRLADFQCEEASPPCPVMEGVLSAGPTGPDQILIRLNGNPAVLVHGLTTPEMQTLLGAVNQHGRLGTPKTGGLSLLQRIGDVPIRPQSANVDELAAALFRNHEALIPLIARWGMPGSDWLLPAEEDFPRISTGALESDSLGTASQDTHKPSRTGDVPQDVVVEEDFLANRAIQQTPRSRQQISEQELERMLGGQVKDPNMLEMLKHLMSGRRPNAL